MLQPSNALLLIEVTLLPILTDVKLQQLLNAESPIEVTLLGIVTEVKLSRLYAKLVGILCTLSPILIVAIGQE